MNTALRMYAAALTVFASLAGAAPARAADVAPLKVGQELSTDIQLDAMDVEPENTAQSTSASPIEIHSRYAAFIKIRFDWIYLPRGVTLEVSNADRRETYRYGRRYANQEMERHTRDPRKGDDGITRFSAMSISGPYVRLRLVGMAQEPWTSQHGVRISRYISGYSDEQQAEMQRAAQGPDMGPQSVCDNDDKEAAVCYVNNDPVAFDRSRPVARMVTPEGTCTAWRVGASNRMFTNHHCAATAAEISASEFWFNYQTTACDGTEQAAVIKVPGDQLLKTDEALDYTLFTVKNFETLADFGYYGLDPRPAKLNEEIFVPGHPAGRAKEIAVLSDADGGGRCRVNDPVTDGNGSNLDLGYRCDTEGGNSGSPVVARSSNRVLALHHLGGCMNEGSRMELIWPQVSSFFNGQVPTGDSSGGPSNATPLADFGYTVNGMSVTYSDRSSDSDGSIASRRWEFGDGATATTANPSRSYAAANRYTVKLTVTDNLGASHSVTQTVNVGVADATMLSNNVPVSGVSGGSGSERYWALQVPEGSSQLQFAISGYGDADLYVRRAGKPSGSSFHCRPFAAGSSESCVFNLPAGGLWYVMLRGFGNYSGVSLVGRYTVTPGVRTYSNDYDVGIRDYTTSFSSVGVSGRSGYASSSSRVSVGVVHSRIGDVRVDLIAPSGRIYILHYYSGGSADNLFVTYQINLSGEPMNGNWYLRVYDGYGGDIGRLDRWSISF